jgi:flagellar biosynthesis chaperone FliJ
LQLQGKRFGSHVLAAVASKIEASPFDKVIRMIKELVDKLTEQVNDEATQKGWCSTELSKNEQSRTTLADDVSNLKNLIDELDASIQKLTQEVMDLSAAIEQLNTAVTEGTAQRTKDSAINAQTVADAKAAEEAVEQALAILQEFYEKAGTATALAQQQPTPPPTWEEAYTGMQSRSGGVIGMLQVILSDFMKLAADTVAQEEADQREFEAFIEDSRVAKLEKEQDIKSKNTLIDKQSARKIESEEDLRTAQKQLDAALDYFEKLKPTCVNTDMSFEERQRRRDEEIQSLKEALRILNGEETS